MTPGQARAARALLKMGVREVAERAKVTPNTVSRVEQDEAGPRGAQPVTIEAIRGVYEAAGIEFIPENGGGAGVRMRWRPGWLRIEATGREESVVFHMAGEKTGELRGPRLFVPEAEAAQRANSKLTLRDSTGKSVAVALQRHYDDGSAVFNVRP